MGAIFIQTTTDHIKESEREGSSGYSTEQAETEPKDGHAEKQTNKQKPKTENAAHCSLCLLKAEGSQMRCFQRIRTNERLKF